VDVDVEALVAGLVQDRPDPADPVAVAAWMHRTLEVLHTPVYRSRELRAALAEDGITDRMGAYLAQRSAPLGPVGAGVVTATFYGFAPTVVAAHLPGVWDVVTPERVLARTLDAMDTLLGRLLADRADAVAELLELLRPVAAAHPTVGRPLAAAWSEVGPTGRPLVDLWLTTCTIRESRGDGHVALLVGEGIGPLASHLLVTGDRPELRAALEATRGWSGEELDATVATLTADGLLDTDGRRTDRARTLRRDLERRTDALAAPPWEHAAGTIDRIAGRIVELLPPVLASGAVPPPVLRLLRPRH